MLKFLRRLFGRPAYTRQEFLDAGERAFGSVGEVPSIEPGDQATTERFVDPLLAERPRKPRGRVQG